MRTRNLPDCGKPKTLPLHFAISNKMTGEVRQLIEGGVNVNLRDHKKRTALMICCLEDDEPWSAGVVRMLLQAGANAAHCDVNGRNALMFSIIFQRTKLVDLLLRAVDFNINQRDVDGNTALQYAIARGNAYTINRVMQERNRQSGRSCLAGNFLTQECVFENRLKISKTKTGKNDIFYDPVKPREPWRRIIDEERASSRIHRSSSELNIHQFRRSTMRLFEIRSRHCQRSVSLSSSSLSSPTSDGSRVESPISRNQVIRPRTARPAPTSKQFYPSLTANKLQRSDFPMIKGDQTWRSFVPMFWHVFKEQSTPSYRPSATPIAQTYEEALGLPPNDVTSEIGDIQESEQVPRKGPSRRSSTASVTIGPSATLTRSRANSLVSADSSRTNDTSGGSTPVPNAVEQTKEIDKASSKLNEVLDKTIPLQHGPDGKIVVIKVNDKKIPVEEATAPTTQQPTRAPRPKSSRHPTTRSRQASTTQNIKHLPDEKQSKPDVSVALSINPRGKEAMSNTSMPNPVEVLAHCENKTESSFSSASGKNSNSQALRENFVDPPKRGGRRPDSFLFRDRVLSDIIEENENPASPVSRFITPTIRCASAHVRGRTANGRLLR